MKYLTGTNIFILIQCFLKVSSALPNLANILGKADQLPEADILPSTATAGNKPQQTQDSSAGNNPQQTQDSSNVFGNPDHIIDAGFSNPPIDAGSYNPPDSSNGLLGLDLDILKPQQTQDSSNGLLGLDLDTMFPNPQDSSHPFTQDSSAGNKPQQTQDSSNVFGNPDHIIDAGYYYKPPDSSNIFGNPNNIIDAGFHRPFSPKPLFSNPQDSSQERPLNRPLFSNPQKRPLLDAFEAGYASGASGADVKLVFQTFAAGFAAGAVKHNGKNVFQDATQAGKDALKQFDDHASHRKQSQRKFDDAFNRPLQQWTADSSDEYDDSFDSLGLVPPIGRGF